MAITPWKDHYRIDIRFKNSNGQRDRYRKVINTADRAIAQKIHDAIANYLRNSGPRPSLVMLPNGTPFDWEPDTRPLNAGIYNIRDLGLAYIDSIPRDVNRELRPGSLRTEVLRTRRIIAHIGKNGLEDPFPCVSAYILELRDKYQSQTRYHYHGTLSRMFGYGVEIGAVAKNPLDRINTPKVTRPPIHPLTQSELRTFLDIAYRIAPHWAPMFQFAAHTGLRLGEIRAAKLSDVGELNNMFHVARAIGPDEKVGPTKNKKNRYIPLLQEALDALEQNRRYGESTWLFTKRDGSPVLKSSYRKQMAKVVKAMGREHNVTMQTLRHTYATLSLSAGVSIKRVSLLLGHGSVKVTEERYDGMTATGDGFELDMAKLRQFWDHAGTKNSDFGSTIPLKKTGSNN